MLTNVSFESLDQIVEKFYNRNLKTTCQDRRSSVLSNSNFQGYELYEPNGLDFPSMRITEKILLGVLHWYFPAELRVLCHLWLEENWGGEFPEIRAVLLTSKRTALGYILVSDRWSSRDFFGNVLKENMVKNIKEMSLRKRSKRKPKRTVRKRGYQDHGTLRPKHDVPMYDYKKFRTLDQQIQKEEFLRQRIIDLENLINDRLMFEMTGFFVE